MQVFLISAILMRAIASDVAAPPPPSLAKPSWQAKLLTYSIASIARREGRTDWNEVTQGNKVVLPREVYDYLVERGLPYDKFQLLNPASRSLRLFTGPLDFCAASGECYLPSWVMRQLGLKTGEPCAVATACFPDCAFVRFQPHESEFLDISDHYVVLTRTLENMGGLTQGASLRVTDGNRMYTLDVLEVKGKPGSSIRDDSNGKAVAIGLMECPIEFAPPKDHMHEKKTNGKAAEGGGQESVTDAVGDGDPAAHGNSSSRSSRRSRAGGGTRSSSSSSSPAREASALDPIDPNSWTSGLVTAAERMRAIADWGPVIPTGWDPDRPPPVTIKAELRIARWRDAATQSTGDARTLGSTSTADNGGKAPKWKPANASSEAEAAVWHAHPAFAAVTTVLAMLQQLLAALLKVIKHLLVPSDVSFE